MKVEQGASIITLLLHVSLQAKEIPGIKIFRSSTTIYYTNADMYLEALQEKVCVCVHQCGCLIEDVCFVLSTTPLIAFISSLSCLTFSSLLLMMIAFLCRVELKSGSCWQRRRKEMQSWSISKRKRKRKLKRMQKNKYILHNTFRDTWSCTNYDYDLNW